MAVRYAKKKWDRYWGIKDKAMVIELLRDKAKAPVHGPPDDMKVGGYAIKAQDIEYFRQDISSYSTTGTVVQGTEIED